MPRMGSTRGFSLIEVLIALIVLSIGLLGLVRITVTSITITSENKLALNAAALVQDRIERMRQTGYSGATAPSTTEAYGTIPNASAYKRVTSVAVNTPATNMKTITVTVSWQHDTKSLMASLILGQ
jgi:type IV pilus assembly protein PilV